MRTTELTGPDLAYWVARANAVGTKQTSMIRRQDYGQQSRNDPASEPHMRRFVEEKIGIVLPARHEWQ